MLPDVIPKQDIYTPPKLLLPIGENLNKNIQEEIEEELQMTGTSRYYTNQAQFMEVIKHLREQNEILKESS